MSFMGESRQQNAEKKPRFNKRIKKFWCKTQQLKEALYSTHNQVIWSDTVITARNYYVILKDLVKSLPHLSSISNIE